MGETNTARIQKVSSEDVKMARNSAAFSVGETVSMFAKQMPKAERSYVSRLKDADIVNFFKNYGYINHEKFQDQAKKDFVRVSCENFDVIFSDYDIAVNCFPQFISSSKFDFGQFVEYCKAVDISPEQAIADIITTDLLTTKFSSYAENRNLHKDNKTLAAFVKLPNSMRRLVKAVQEKTMAVNKLEGNKGKYGSFDIEHYSPNPHGEGTNE